MDLIQANCIFKKTSIGQIITQLINPALHIQSGLANLKSKTTGISQLAKAQIKTTLVPFTKTFKTSLEHIPVKYTVVATTSPSSLKVGNSKTAWVDQ